MLRLPADVGSDPRSEVDLWTSGRGPKVPQRSTAPPPPPPDSPVSMLLLEELMSDPALLNQLLQTRTRSVQATYGAACWRARVPVPPLLLGRAVWRAGWRGLGGGGQSVLPRLQTLDLQLLRWRRKRFGLTEPGSSYPPTSPSRPRAFPGGSHLERVGHAVVVPRLLGRQAFVGGVAAVGQPHPLLKRLHALLSLLWDTETVVSAGPAPSVTPPPQ